ncbi:MAG: cyclase family protein [Bacteroidetes bacterium]|nr:cyclase family protein [Bacteroidota bacterium]
MDANNWIDISATISDGMTRWPDDPPVQVSRAETIAAGAEANVTQISTTAHVGTHIDAPLHFIEGGMDAASVPLEKLVGKAKVFHIHNPKEIGLAEIRNFDIEAGDRILFRTANSEMEWEHLPFVEDYVYLATDVAKYLAEKKINCVGIDYLSLGNKANDGEVHRLILGAGIIIIEGLKLKDIEAGDYEMVCLPLKIKDSDGGPCRVMIKSHHRS